MLSGFGQNPRLSNIEIHPIGIVHSPYKQASGTPVQPCLASGVQGTVEVLEEFQEGIEDLDDFERIWLICWLHRAAKPRLRVVPYLGDTEHGLFATRAPSRPNPIGISPVRLLRIDGNTLTVADLDIIDGTPLLDIKPYSPHFDCFEGIRSGWLDQSTRTQRLADGRFED